MSPGSLKSSPNTGEFISTFAQLHVRDESLTDLGVLAALCGTSNHAPFQIPSVPVANVALVPIVQGETRALLKLTGSCIDYFEVIF